MKWNHVLWSVGISNLYNIYYSHTCVCTGLFSIIFHVLFSFFFGYLAPFSGSKMCLIFSLWIFQCAFIVFERRHDVIPRICSSFSDEMLEHFSVVPFLLLNVHYWISLWHRAHIYRYYMSDSLLRIKWMCSTFNDFDFWMIWTCRLLAVPPWLSTYMIITKNVSIGIPKRKYSFSKRLRFFFVVNINAIDWIVAFELYSTYYLYTREKNISKTR